MKRLFWLLPVLLAMLMTGCLKDDLQEGTIVLLGTESNVKPIDSVIPATLLDFIADADSMSPASVLDLPMGNMPPDIQGEFVLTPIELYADNGHHPVPNDTLFIRFGGKAEAYPVEVEIEYHSGDTLIHGNDTLVFDADTTMVTTETAYYYPQGQHNMLVPCDLYGDVPEKGNEYHKKHADAYVKGAGSEFTVYFTIDYDCEEEGSEVEFTLTRGYIITGSMTKEGIENVVVACVNIKAEPTNTSTTVPDSSIHSMENRIYVYRVQGNPINPFGMAVRQDWY